MSELDPRRWWMLPVILIGSFLSFLDFFIVNIALPAMRDDMGASPAQLQLVVAGYGIGFAVSLITGGRLGDIYGRKRVFLLGLVGFTLASLFCGAAVNPQMLIAARVAQAICAATLTPQVLAIIRVEFAAHERAFAVGLYGTSMGFASIVAQLLGGLLVSMNLFGWTWRLIFLVNVPIGLIAFCLAALMLRESRTDARSTLDLPGVALVSLALSLLIYPLVEGRESDWPAWSFVMLAAVAPVMVGFLLFERSVVRRGRTPLVALHLFREPAIAFGLIVSVVFFSGLAIYFVVLTVFFQLGRGYSALQTGLLFLPFAIGFTATASMSGPITARIGPHVIKMGIGLMAIGLTATIALLYYGWERPWMLAPAFLVYGIGQGLAQPALINTVVVGSGVSGVDAGSAAGLFLTAAQSSIALGVAAIGDVFFARIGTAPTQSDYAAALLDALSCNLALQIAALVLVLFVPLLARRTATFASGP